MKSLVIKDDSWHLDLEMSEPVDIFKEETGMKIVLDASSLKR